MTWPLFGHCNPRMDRSPVKSAHAPCNTAKSPCDVVLIAGVHACQVNYRPGQTIVPSLMYQPDEDGLHTAQVSEVVLNWTTCDL